MNSGDERENSERRESENQSQSAPNAPLFTWKEAPFVLLLLPFGLLLGFHVALLAMFIRWLTRLPYWIAFVLLYVLMICPLWIFSGANVVLLTIGSIVVVLGSLIPRVFDDQDGILNGGNFEHSAQAHILLVLLYLLVSPVNAVIETFQRQQEEQSKGLEAGAPTTRSDDSESLPLPGDLLRSAISP